MSNTTLPQALKLKIDVSKIDSDVLYQGEKGLYLSLIARATPNSKYGDDYMVVIPVKGGDDIILGNASVLEDRPQYKKPVKKNKNQLPWEM